MWCPHITLGTLVSAGSDTRRATVWMTSPRVFPKGWHSHPLRVCAAIALFRLENALEPFCFIPQMLLFGNFLFQDPNKIFQCQNKLSLEGQYVSFTFAQCTPLKDITCFEGSNSSWTLARTGLTTAVFSLA